MHHYFEAITNNKGDALTGYYVRLVDSGGSGVTLYADTSLTPIISVSGVADAAKVDADGNVDFYVAVGTYTLNIYATDSTTLVRSIRDVGMNIDMDTAATAVAAQTAATASATAASNSAASAATSATSASTSSSSASTSATNAATSATSAAGSATTAAAAASSVSSVPNATAHAATRAALALLSTASPAYLVEAGREGTFVWSSANNSALVTADTAQGIYVAPSSDTSGASGAWIRKYNGVIQARWFGGTWDGIANDGPTVLAAKAVADAIVTNGSTGYGVAVPTIELPFTAAGVNMGTSKFTFTHGMCLKGQSGGEYGGAATLMKWSAGVIGLQIDASNSSIENLALIGGWVNGSTSEGEYHAIKAHQKFTYRNLYIANWQGDGVYVNISVGSGGDTEGNANCMWGERFAINGCRNGLNIAGSDVNASNFAGADINNCRQAAIIDNSFLGNTYLGSQTATNGQTGATGVPTTCAYNNGHIFYCIYGQETGASTNSPPSTAISNTWWGYLQDASAQSWCPQWVSGTTYRAGGAFLGNAVNGQQVLLNPYNESGQPPAQLGQNTLVIGGQGGFKSGTRRIYAKSDGIHLDSGPSNSITIDGAFTVNNSGGVNQLNADTFNFNSSGAQEPRLQFYTNAVQTGYINAHSTGFYYNSPSHHFRIGGTDQGVLDGSGLALTGTITASNFSGTSSGTNTGNQTITLTSDVTGSGTGSFATTIAANAVTYAKFQQVAASSLVGNATGSLANATGITLAADHSFSGSTLQLGAFTGDITKTAGSLATTVAANAVTYAKFQQVAASSLVGNATGSLANATGITLAGGLAFSGSTLTAAGALTPTSVASIGAITSSSAAAGSGYATGAGGAVTQLTSRTTGVTLSKPCGAITLFSAAGSTTYNTFTVTNTLVAATDVVEVSQKSGANLYNALVTAVAAGSFNLSVSAVSGTATEAPVINFVVTKAVAA